MPFLQLTVELGREAPDAAEAACFAAGALAVTLADAGEQTLLEPAPGETPLWPLLRLQALFPAGTAQALVEATLQALAGLSGPSLRWEAVEDRAWEREWLRDFRPMRFGRRLWVCPGGQAAPEPGAVVLELDPGLAFGTGTHPTTALCLEWLDAAPLAGCRLLDYGCGSGILALAALKLGAARAWALDHDPQALTAARANAAHNGLGERLEVVADPAALPRPFDVVVANILSGPLIALAPSLAGCCRPGGAIALAGLLDAQAPEVAAAYRPWFDIRAMAARGGWTLLAGERRAE